MQFNKYIHTYIHTLYRQYGRKLTDYFQPWGQYGVAVSDGVEIMAFTATLGFEEGCTILLYDGANAFNGIYRHRFLPALAEIVSLSGPLRIKLVRTGTPKTPVCTRWWRFGSG